MKLTSALCLFTLLSPAAFGGVLSISNQILGPGDIAIVYASGSVATNGIATGGFFTTGYDVNSGLSMATTTGDFSDFLSNFNLLVTDIIGADGGAVAAGFYFASADYGMPGVNPPVGAELYSILGNAGSLTASDQFAVLRSSDTVGLDIPAPDDNSILLPNNSTVLLGTPGTVLYDFGSGAQSTPSLGLVQAIPEPSALLLSWIGVLGLLRRKR